MNDYEVYEWYDLKNGEPFYVGRGKGGRKYVTNRNSAFNNRLKIIGIENCVVIVLHKNLSEIESGEIESWYINEYKYIMGYELSNVYGGGEGGKQKNKRNLEHSAKISFALQNMDSNTRKNWKRKISIKNRGRIWTDEQRKNLSNSKKGKPLSPLQLQALKNRTGNKNPMYGKHHTEDAKKRMSEKLSGGNNPFASNFNAIFPDGKIIYFETLKNMKKYFKDEYDLSVKPLMKLYNNNETYNPRLKKHENLKGLKIIKL